MVTVVALSSSSAGMSWFRCAQVRCTRCACGAVRFWPHAPGSASASHSSGHMPKAKRLRCAPWSAGHLPQAEARKCQRLSKRGSHFVGSAWGKWLRGGGGAAAMFGLYFSARHELQKHRLFSQARLAQSAERKAFNLVVVGSSPTVGVGAFFTM